MINYIAIATSKFIINKIVRLHIVKFMPCACVYYTNILYLLFTKYHVHPDHDWDICFMHVCYEVAIAFESDRLSSGAS